MQLVMDNKALSQEELYKNQILFQLCHSWPLILVSPVA
jgi:hypothetical protein